MSIVDDFATGIYQVIRSKGGYYHEGFYQEGGKETVYISGSLQPLNGRELKLLQEEGMRLKQVWKFYSDLPLVVLDTKTLADSDKVMINGESYKVISQEIWQGFDLQYFKTVLTREPEQ